MRKLPLAGAAAAVLAVAVTATVFPLPAAAGAGPARPPQDASGGVPGLQPGGLAVLLPGRHPLRPRGRHLGSEFSLNWGGYAASGNRFRYVQATFFVPYLNCAATPGTFSAHWAGLDGLRNSTVEQTGISADCRGTTARYRAWYEIAPRPPVFQNMTIRPGESVVASVYYHRRTGKFTLALTDTTSGRHFRRTASCPSGLICQRASAEVISEAPLGSGGYLPLADFRAEGYSDVRVTSQAGRHGGLRSSHWETTRLTTISQDGGILDQPTSLYRGTAFGMYWLRQR